jgi:hypothetical protein
MAAAPRIMPAQPRSDAPGFDQVDVDTCYWNAELPDLGLVNDLRLPYFIYILACEPRSWSGPKTMYVGIAKRSQIARRIQTDAGQGPSAPHFCQTYKPQYILGVWPAASRAAEAMAFYALVAKRSERFLACGSLGGWTQTSTDLSKLSKQNLERERRMVTESCLKCGSGEHVARTCQAVAYTFVTCAHCNSQNRISDQGTVLGVERAMVRPRGEEVTAVRVVRPRVAEAALPARASAAAPAVPAPRAAAAAAAHAAPAAQAAPPARDFLRVRLCGVGYTTLAWYLGKPNPTPREVRLALEHGRSNAAVMSDGQTSTLVAAGFAKKGPGLPAELFPAGDGVLPEYPLSTRAKTVKAGLALKVRKAPARLTGSRNVLFRVSDLHTVRWR